MESEQVGLKLIIQKTKIMELAPITSWQIDGETVETVSDFIFGGSRITTDSEGDQPWVFFGRNEAKAEAPVLWTPHVKS